MCNKKPPSLFQSFRIQLQKKLPTFDELNEMEQGSKLKKMSGRKFATSYESLVATLKTLVAKLIEAI